MKAQLRIKISVPQEDLSGSPVFKYVIDDFPFNACTTEDQISLHEEGIMVTVAHVAYRRLRGEWAMVIICKPHPVDGKEEYEKTVEEYKRKGWTT